MLRHALLLFSTGFILWLLASPALPDVPVRCPCFNSMQIVGTCTGVLARDGEVTLEDSATLTRLRCTIDDGKFETVGHSYVALTARGGSCAHSLISPAGLAGNPSRGGISAEGGIGSAVANQCVSAIQDAAFTLGVE